MKKKTQIRLLWTAVGLVLFYTLAGFFLLPWIVRSQMLKRLPDILNREVALERVRFNPYTFTFGMENFAVTDTDGEPFMALGKLTANFQPVGSLFQKGYTFKELALETPYLRVRRNADLSLNFSDLIPEDSPGEPEEPAEPPVLRVRELRVEGGVLTIEDLSLPTHYNKEVRDIRFTIANLTTEVGESGQHQFDAVSEGEEVFVWTGDLRLNPLSLSGVIEVHDFQLPGLMPYGEPVVRGKLESGSLSLHLPYAAALGPEGPEYSLTGGLLALDNLAFRMPDEEASLIAWQSLRVEGIDLRWPENSLHIDQVALDQPSAFVHRLADGSINLLGIFRLPEREAIPDIPEEPEAAGTPWSLLVDNLRVTDGSFRLLDEALDSAADLTLELTLAEIEQLGNLEGQTYSLRLQLAQGTEGALDLSGNGTVVPIAGEFAYQLSGWDLSPLDPYLGQFAEARLESAIAEADGTLSFVLGDSRIDAFLVEGQGGLNSFALKNTEGDPLASWGSLHATGVRFDQIAGTLAVESVDWLNPTFGLILHEDGSTSIARLLKNSAAAEAENSSPAESMEPVSPDPEPPTAEEEPLPTGKEPPSLAVSLGRFGITNGSFQFQDLGQSPAVQLGVEQVNGSISGLSSNPSARPDVSMEMLVMGITPLSVGGSLNFLSSEPYADLTLLLKGLELTHFGPYFSRYVGYHLEKGLLNLDLHYSVEDQILTASNAVLVNQLTLGQNSGSPDATGLPVPLAVSLLKDPGGNIKIDLPIEGNLADPDFRIGGIILRSLSNLILKIASSPFNLLAGLVNVSPEDLQAVSFEPGHDSLNDAAHTSLDALALAMEQRPGISLEIAASIDPDLETPALRKVKLRERIERLVGSEVSANLTGEERYQALVEKAYRQTFPVVVQTGRLPPFQEMEAALLEKQTVDANDLNQLAVSRKQAIRNYLLAKETITPDRVLVVEAASLETVATGTSQASLNIR